MVESACRDGFFAAIIIEAALRLAAKPACLDIFHEEGARTVLGVREPVMEHLHDGEAGIEADKVGKLKRTHRVVRTELHGLVDAFDRTNAFIKRIDSL